MCSCARLWWLFRLAVQTLTRPLFLRSGAHATQAARPFGRAGLARASGLGFCHVDSRRPVVVVDLRNETGAAAAGEINPKPAQGHHQPITQTNQEVDVCQPPQPPRNVASDLPPAEIDDGRAFAYRREIPGVPIPKCPRLKIPCQPSLDRAPYILSLLLGGRRDS